MLVWLFMQQDEFDAAFIYSKALDKRLNEDGHRMYELATIAHENQAYKAAIDAYEYLIKKGNPTYLLEAKILDVIAKADQTLGNTHTINDLEKIDNEYQGVINDDQGEFGPHWYGGFMGLNDGEQLNLMLSIKSFHPIGDGRWQIQAEELDDIDLDRLVFGKLNDGPLSDENEVRFILRSGRLLALDLLLLEALLIVNEQPRGDVLHIQWDMVSDPGMSSLSSPAWTSRPDSVSSEDWRRVTTAVKPDLLSVSFCDCGIDAMELSIRSNSPSTNDLITPKGIETSNGLIPNDFWVAVLGFAVLIAAAVVEKERRDKGMSLASQILN